MHADTVLQDLVVKRTPKFFDLSKIGEKS